MLSRLFASRQRPFIPRRHERERVAIDLSGSRLAFSLPLNACHDSFADPSQEPPQSVNIFDNSNYFDDSKREEWKREGVARQILMKRSWELFGPIWRSRPIGYISFVLTLNRHDALPEDMSCLNPQHFEQVIIRALYYNGPCQPNHKVQQAPVNWQLHKLDGTTPIFFEKHQQHSPESLAECPFYDTHFSSFFFIPLDQRHYIYFVFNYLGYAPVKPCLKAMNSIRDSVCDSVELQLGADAKTQLSRVQQQWPGAKASAKRDIEPWVYPEWYETDDFEGKIIITKPGSPPPTWQA
ncbi:hypothetical protein MO867_18005 [Microbulbifer sp. OS29]|uniref:Uncharacterized protein n=1 Tax=Microbulbifer okhotskensis TaxID=2926617 RepID=A0A9X2EVH2_9GAMM|nr:hypothetical protein [Microbulbifer okhotskensis]MCO1336228.1 hypothetical protein [Microbulbifer okhotskensis]